MTNHIYRILLLLLCIGSCYAQELPQSPISAGRDTEVAAFLLALAVPFALKLNEPYALRRLEEFEAEYYKLTGKNIQSLTLMKQRYHKAQKHHETSAPLLVNMAGVFLANKQYDSAIYYSKEAIRLSRSTDSLVPNSYYWSLKEAYRLKGDYRAAYYAMVVARSLPPLIRNPFHRPLPKSDWICSLTKPKRTTPTLSLPHEKPLKADIV